MLEWLPWAGGHLVRGDEHRQMDKLTVVRVLAEPLMMNNSAGVFNANGHGAARHTPENERHAVTFTQIVMGISTPP
jgi:hypothetical protein